MTRNKLECLDLVITFSKLNPKGEVRFRPKQTSLYQLILSLQASTPLFALMSTGEVE